MKIIVTGSNGIIGRQLLQQLLEFYPEAEFYVINKNISNGTDRVRSIELDLLLLDQEQSDKIVSSIKPDLFFHLAWDTGHSDYLNTPNNHIWEKISITLINSFYKAGGKKFIGIGSSIEYNWDLPNPFDESTSPVNGNKWLYGHSKLNVYNYLASLTGVSYLWCRVFFVFGPGQSTGRLVPLLINNAFGNGSPLTLNLDLKRDYISTFEIAKQVILMTNTAYSGPVNICSGRPILLKDLVVLIEKEAGNKISISPVKYKDSFEIISLGGSRSLFQKYYPSYSYSDLDFQKDMVRTIDSIKIK